MEIMAKNGDKRKARAKLILLVINSLILLVGNCGGPLISRLYYVNGGTRVWLSSALETGGWPVILIPLVIGYIIRRQKAAKSTDDDAVDTRLVQIKLPLFLAAAVIGILTGFDDYLYAYGVKYLPVSTASLLIATQLAFCAVFGYFMVKQRFTPYNINAVLLLTVGAGVLAMHTNGDKPQHESHKQYLMGFIMTLIAAVLYGFIMPLVELTYKMAKQKMTYTLVLEFNMVMCFFATCVCVGGIIIRNDFPVIVREAHEFKLGLTKYIIVVVAQAIIWQGFFLGTVGVIYSSSSLFSGILIAVLLPVTEVLSVIFFKESFTAEKGVSLALSLWGFVSYFYGEIKNSKGESPETETREGQEA